MKRPVSTPLDWRHWPALLVIAGCFLTASSLTPAAAQTGSRTGGKSQPTTAYWLDAPGAVSRVRQMLQAGKKVAALKEARKFVNSLGTMTNMNGGPVDYYGMLVLCAAETVNGLHRDAIASCSKAIALYPGRWQALNNRGNAYYLMGNNAAAISDYRAAMATNPPSEDVRAIIAHNMALAEGAAGKRPGS